MGDRDHPEPRVTTADHPRVSILWGVRFTVSLIIGVNGEFLEMGKGLLEAKPVGEQAASSGAVDDIGGASCCRIVFSMERPSIGRELHRLYPGFFSNLAS